MKLRFLRITSFILNILLKTNRFYLFSSLRDSVSRKSLFLSKTGKTWHHSDVIYGRIKASEFSFVRMRQIDGWESSGNLAIIQ